MICYQWLKKALYEEYVIQFTDMQKLPVNKFEWIEDTSSFNEDFIKSYDGENDEGYSL